MEDAAGLGPTSTVVTSPEGTAGGHRLALVVISVTQLMVVLDATIVNIALPSIQRALHFSGTDLDWVINAYALAFGGLLLAGGRAGDLFGRRRVFMAGVGLFTVASLLGGLAESAGWLLAARVAQGVGAAVASPTALSLITDTFAEGRSRNKAMGVYAAMSAAGGSLGLLLGGVLTDVLSWRFVLFVNVPLGLGVLVVTPFVVRPGVHRPGRLDWPGALAVTAAMTFVVYGLTEAATRGWAAPPTVGALAAAGVGLASFVVIEWRQPEPVVPLRIFLHAGRAGTYAVALCLGGAMFGMFYFLTQWVQDVLGFTPLEAGLAFVPISLGVVVLAGVVSQLLHRIGPRLPMAVGSVLAGAGMLWLAGLEPTSSYLGGIVGPGILIAVGMGFAFVPMTVTAVSDVASGDAGLASALLNTGQEIGGALGLAIMVAVATASATAQVEALAARYHVHVHERGIPPPTHLHGVLAHHLYDQVVTSAFTTGFLVSAGLCFAAATVAAVAIPRRVDAKPSGAP